MDSSQRIIWWKEELGVVVCQEQYLYKRKGRGVRRVLDEYDSGSRMRFLIWSFICSCYLGVFVLVRG